MSFIHKMFRRNGNDLIMEMNLQLVEALCGFHKAIETMDGRTMVISTIPGTAISLRIFLDFPGSVQDSFRILKIIIFNHYAEFSSSMDHN